MPSQTMELPQPPACIDAAIERGCVEYFQPEGGVVQQAGQVGVLQGADQPVLDGVPVGPAGR